MDRISDLSFDTNTIWGENKQLPKGFTPETWLETGKDPGLNIRKLHKDDYTGKGVSVAVIDKPIYPDNQEFNKQNFTYITIGTEDKPHFHGISCASILAGKSCGVAPEAMLYYFAVPDDGNNFENYPKAIDKIIELNQTLDKDDKIRIVSISDGLNEDDSRRENWEQTVRKAADKGILVIYSNNIDNQFAWGGCPPYKDRNDPSNYQIDKIFKDNNVVDKTWIIIPGDFRTTANNQSDKGYTYYGQGGWSWAIPYYAGLCTLGLEIDPDFSYDQLQQTLKSTKTQAADGHYMVNPVEYIKALEELKNNEV